MKRKLTKAGWVMAVAMAASLALLGAGAYKLIALDRSMDDGARRVRTLLKQQETSEQSDMPEAVDLDGLKAVGILTFCRDTHTATPIYYGTQTEVLEKGVGQAEDTATLNTAGNSVLFGHRDSAFREIEHLNEQDVLTVETADKTLDYVVTRIYITDPDDPHIYDTTDDTTLTLVTCYPFSFVGPAPERCVVIAKCMDATMM